jgi:hypothetical protein
MDNARDTEQKLRWLKDFVTAGGSSEQKQRGQHSRMPQPDGMKSWKAFRSLSEATFRWGRESIQTAFEIPVDPNQNLKPTVRDVWKADWMEETGVAGGTPA